MSEVGIGVPMFMRDVLRDVGDRVDLIEAGRAFLGEDAREEGQRA